MNLISNHIMRGCLFAMLVLFTGALMAQTTVNGTITDAENGDPLIGASVLVTGTSTGTVTDFDGNFTINVPANAESLTISYTGYSTQVIEMTGQTQLNIELASGELLEEVVVVGYGSVKKSDLTGAVVALTDKDFNGGVIVSPEQLIQGRAAGVQITETSGEPGAAVNIRIRGTSSVGSNNNPLFVVDGVPLDADATSASGNIAGLGAAPARNPLNFLNPSDIASIDVLKDASATAIYGSRGANGVVLITTKSGAGNAGVLQFSTSVGFSNITRKYDLLSANEFLDAYEDLNDATARQLIDGGAETDWQDEVFRTALTTNNSVSFGDGNEDGNYRFSLSHLDQEGIVENSGLERLTGRFNGSKKFINDRLTISTQITVSDIHDDNVPATSNSGFEGDLIGNVLKANPTQPVLGGNPDDENNRSIYNQVSNTEPNPVALLNLYEGFTNTLRTLANVSADLQIADGLSFKTVVGIDRSRSSRTDAQSPDLRLNNVLNSGRLDLNDLNVSNNLWENYFTYDRDLGSIGFTGLVGYSYQRFQRDGRGASYRNFRTTDLTQIVSNLTAADQVGTPGSGLGTYSFNVVDELQSYFTRVNFDVNDKYILTATVRADGSTRFGEENRYGIFPSFAFKWRLLEESWAPQSFSTLGLRVGYGVVGNQAIPNNQHQQRERFGGVNFDANGNPAGGNLGTVAFANDQLQWESTAQINAGIDWGFSNNRISGSIDYYRKNTNDLLIQVRAAQPAVQPFVFENLDADIINEGVELAINYVAVDKPNFSWDINFNVAYNNNVVQNFAGLINTGDIDGQGLTGAFAQRIAEGQSLYAYFLREFGGYDSEGVSIYPNGDVQEFTGDSPLPTTTGGITNSFVIGNFDATIFFSGQFGHSIYSNTANAFFTAGSLANGRNVTTDVVGNGEGAFNAPDVSTRFLESGDFVRLQNVSLGYSIPVQGDVISGLRFTVSGQNLFVIDSYSGQDPEVSISKPIDGIPSIGIDYTAFPRARTVTLGLNASF